MHGRLRRNPHLLALCRRPRRVGIASPRRISFIEQARREALGQKRTEDRRCEHQHENYVQHMVVKQPLAAGTQRVVCDQCRGERGGDLRQRQRPDS